MMVLRTSYRLHGIYEGIDGRFIIQYPDGHYSDYTYGSVEEAKRVIQWQKNHYDKDRIS